MSTLQTNEEIVRAIPFDTVELTGAEGRTLSSRLFKWNTVSSVRDFNGPVYQEEWMPCVFAQSIRRAQSTKRGWPLMYHHAMNSVPIGMVGFGLGFARRFRRMPGVEHVDDLFEALRSGRRGVIFDVANEGAERVEIFID